MLTKHLKRLFIAYCTNFYCAPLWCNYTIGIMMVVYATGHPQTWDVLLPLLTMAYSAELHENKCFSPNLVSGSALDWRPTGRGFEPRLSLGHVSQIFRLIVPGDPCPDMTKVVERFHSFCVKLSIIKLKSAITMSICFSIDRKSNAKHR